MIDINQLKSDPADTTGTDHADGRKRILLVEGDGFTRLVLLFRLRLAGFQVDFTSNGILAMTKLRSHCPDAMLVELKLNGLSGLNLIKAARSDPAFGNRPIYVFTYAEQMKRSTRREVSMLATAVLDKANVSREEVVQTFLKAFAPPARPAGKSSPGKEAPLAPPQPEQAVQVLSAGELDEIIAGVREQSKVFAQSGEASEKLASCRELLSRVCSVASCAEAAGLANLNRHARALENFLQQLCQEKRAFEGALSTENRAVEVMASLSSGSPAAGKELSQFRAVVVDEAPESSRAAQEALKEAGFEVVCFSEPVGVHEHLAAHRADVIIANVLLPEAHGLALTDVRQLPLHTETAVIFVPDSSLDEHSPGELPTSAPRLDSNPLLLKELVMKALNEAQSTGLPPQPAPAPAAAEPASNLNARQMPALDDGFELFSGPRHQAPVADTTAPAEAAMFTAADTSLAQPETVTGTPDDEIPAEPFQWTKPAAAAAEGQAEVFVRLPETQNDNLQADDQRMEVFQMSAVQPEAPETAQAELAPQDQAVPPEWAAALEAQAGQAVQEADPVTQPATTGGAVADELTATAPAETTAGTEELHMAEGDNAQAGVSGWPGLTPESTEQNGSEVSEATPANGAEEQFAAPAASAPEPEAPAAELPAPEPSPAEEPSRQVEAAHPAEHTDLEQQVRQAVADLSRATAELAQERGARQRSEQRVVALNGRVKELHEELGHTLVAHTETLERAGTLEKQLRETEETLARRTAEAEQQAAERRLADEQWRKTKELAAGMRKNLAFFEAAHEKAEKTRQELQARLEASLSAAAENEAKLQRERAERQRVAETAERLQREAQSSHREALENELQSTREALHDTEARLQAETAERQRLNEALDAAQLKLQERAQRSDLEFHKLQSALQLEQVERQTQEAELSRLQHGSVDAVRAARALRNSLRRQIGEPVNDLYHSARRLLELELGPEQKQAAEAVLQNALLLHTKLREPDRAPSDAGDVDGAH